MPPILSGRTKPTKPKKQARSLKRKREGEDIEALEKAVEVLDPKNATLTTFSDLPLSRPTSSGLEASNFRTLTAVQAKVIPFALKAADCLGAAKTGSGKTLAFLVPVLEILYRRRWTELDGLGVLIISPTRELAIQIFDVLRQIGRYHNFSAGLVIGGRSLQEERDRLGRMNILVCTPGRMLQHMDQTAAFEVANLQILVLDEADRIMDMGFQTTVDAIIDHLPKERQTMLFSATQTKKVSDLARLSLKDPEYIAVHEAADSATPSTLRQHYVITPLPQKLNTLYSFLRSNVHAKILVFMSSGKQVRFVYESFRRLQPGIPLLHLHGRQKQTARLEVTFKFSTAKYSCLFATDVVARGLDFPAVDWVLQLDCPEDADTYIHRVGRTARYERDGRAALFLDPSEEPGMLQRFQQKRIPIERVNIREKKQQSIQDLLQNMCFKDPELKYLGQKAFMSYARSVYLQKDKDVFQIDRLPLEEFSASLGLPGAPKIKFLKGDDPKRLKNASRQEIVSEDDEENRDASGVTDVTAKNQKGAVRTKYDRMFARRNQDVLAPHYSKIVYEDGDGAFDGQDAAADDTFLTVKRRVNPEDDNRFDEEIRGSEPTSKHVAIPVVGGGESLIIDSKRREKLLQSKKKLLKLKGKGTKLIYDDEGVPHEVYELEDEDQFRQRGDPESQRHQFVEEERSRVVAADVSDKQLAKTKRKVKREKRKGREREGRNEDHGGMQVELAPYDEASGEEGVQTERVVEDRDSLQQRPSKRPKKWFEEDGPAERRRKDESFKRRSFDLLEEPRDLDELEALAVGLLQ